jgi:hypothetical protein
MRNFLIGLTLILTSSSFAGGFRWPLVEYDHAKIFLFNVDLESEADFDWHIYQDGVYASSKIGDGISLKEDDLGKIHGALARGVDELLLGLSKCYLPRHGIIYYDKVGKPVASFSICLECEKISFWDNVNGAVPINDPKKFNIKKAEAQISELTDLISSTGLPVFNKGDLYKDYMKDNRDLENRGEMFIQLSNKDAMAMSRYSIEEVKSWVVDVFHGARLKETEETKITAGGQKWTYKQLSSENSRFIFSFDEENPFLVEANLRDDNIILPNGVSVGMSTDDVIGTFIVYDGIAWPEMIEVKNEKLTIRYHFKNRTLQRIELLFSVL